MKRTVILTTVLLALTAVSARSISISELKGKRVSVMAYAQTADQKKFERAAQGKLEEVLSENGIEVLDYYKTKELKTDWQALAGKDHNITPEEFVAKTRDLKLDGVLRVYFELDSVRGIGAFYSATASVDMRLVDPRARVSTGQSDLMGIPRNPASEGTTESAAMLNALDRALETGARKLGMEITLHTRRRRIPVQLDGPVAVAGVSIVESARRDDQFNGVAKLFGEKWKSEKVTTAVVSSDGNYAAICGYVTDTDFRRRPPRVYASRVHLIDARERRPINEFWCYQVGKKARDEGGSREIASAMFIGGWQYLAAVSGSHLFFWDTETGTEMNRINLSPVRDGKLSLVRDGAGSYYVAVGSGSSAKYFRIKQGN